VVAGGDAKGRTGDGGRIVRPVWSRKSPPPPPTKPTRSRGVARGSCSGLSDERSRDGESEGGAEW